MEANLNQNLLKKDPAATLLIGLLTEQEKKLRLEQGFLYHEFPLFVTDENQPVTANVLLINPNHGIVIFKCDNSRVLDKERLGKLYDELDQVYSQVFSRLIRSKILRVSRTELLINIKTILFLPNLTIETFEENKTSFKKDMELVVNLQTLEGCLDTFYLKKGVESVVIKETLSILEGSKGIIKPKQRNIENLKEGSRGEILDKIEAEIAVFDKEQKKAALYIVDGPQRIRGLAGSGKTIVLAMKAALIHLYEPNVEILYTFYTKSLYSFVKRLITRFYREYSEVDPNWDKIHILHAWGGQNLQGVYYNACLKNNVTPLSFKDVNFEKQAFDKVCEELCKNDLKVMYDYSILDEGQDFPANFYRLCRRITKNSRIIWGYDECQNILDIVIQDTKQTFGINKDGQYFVDFSKAAEDSPCDIVLYRCYRNPRRVLVAAFALGLGIYNERILQLPENNEHWKDLGFEVKEGDSKKGDSMVITRPAENSPLMKNMYLEKEETVSIEICKSMEEEIDFVAKKVKQDLEEGLLPEDILIVALDDLNARKYFRAFEKRFNSMNIATFNLLDAPFDNKEFYLSKHITLSTVYRAKGNESGSVYIVGVDAIFANMNSIQERNKLFTAMTRTKGWVILTGIGAEAKLCQREIEKTFKNYPDLVFEMPDQKQLKVFQRDLADRQDKINKIERQLDKLANELGMSKTKLSEYLEEIKKSKKIAK